ncbi:5'-methylthioadenosine/S-adenosylhomocysteine nucleosidase [Boudabousia marimammalium]|uniref:adenosylhomocysteine nucleosidase n=1 Tax=Boudabousia marimammalium TaxID=156892 RepID=A0A1Q5PSI3_9ACTO|nr:5'-methylthioadenosine/S-adenosylhomocysteine nucleosidase [Boudabousia marimammalium]OKL50537.1 hypothetical protein BM477_00775 [Boudabousia marimammalium]
MFVPATDAAADSQKSLLDAVVICAMDSEAAPFLAMSTLDPKPDPLKPDFKNGKAEGWVIRIGEHQLLVVKSGIGISNASAAATWAINLTAAPLLFSAGSAGGLAASVNVGEVIVSSASRYSQVDATAFGYEKGQLPGEPVSFDSPAELVKLATENGGIAGQIISADRFVMSDTVDRFRTDFPEALAVDMETAGLAQVASHFNTPFMSVRGISDLCGPAADQDHHREVDEVAASAAKVVMAVIDGHKAAQN